MSAGSDPVIKDGWVAEGRHHKIGRWVKQYTTTDSLGLVTVTSLQELLALTSMTN